MVSPKHLKFVLPAERRQEVYIRGRVVRSELGLERNPSSRLESGWCGREKGCRGIVCKGSVMVTIDFHLDRL